MGEEEDNTTGVGECGWAVSGGCGRREGLLPFCFSRGVRTSCLLLSEDVFGRSVEMDIDRLFLLRLFNFKLFLILSTSRPTSKVRRDMMGEVLAVLGKVR